MVCRHRVEGRVRRVCGRPGARPGARIHPRRAGPERDHEVLARGARARRICLALCQARAPPAIKRPGQPGLLCAGGGGSARAREHDRIPPNPPPPPRACTLRPRRGGRHNTRCFRCHPALFGRPRRLFFVAPLATRACACSAAPRHHHHTADRPPTERAPPALRPQPCSRRPRTSAKYRRTRSAGLPWCS